jgi:hypothetical protein
MKTEKRKIIIPVDKEKFYKENTPLVIGFNEKRKCIHCGKVINVKDYKVERIYGYDKVYNYLIVCPNAPECDGTIIDWVSIK